MIKLEQLKEMYKMSRMSLTGIHEASIRYGISEYYVKLYIQSEDKLYPQIRFKVSQCLPVWFLREMGYSVKEIATMNHITVDQTNKIIDAMDKYSDTYVNRKIDIMDIYEMKSLRAKRHTYKEIGERFNMSAINIKEALEPYKDGLPRHVSGRVRQTTKNDIDKMKELREKGYSYSEISNKVNKSIATVFTYVNDKRPQI